ncbi:chromatin assembly factor 1 subunit A-domain-containing protein [Hypoxylon cercidicola]|nr:chromatin assembly factor 1 subunit A-domain-containing protein [Hypoxylon cercidicola]
MPLFSISPNIQESETSSRKRTHEEFIDDPSQLAIGITSNSENLGAQKSIEVPTLTSHDLHLSPAPEVNMSPTPGSSPAGLTESGSSPPIQGSPSPSKTPSRSHPVEGKSSSKPTHAATTAASVPTSKNTPAKRKLTAAEERAEKRQKREAEAAEKLQRKEAEAAERLRKKEAEAAERAKKKAAEEEAKAARATERAKKDAERAQKKAEDEAKKRKKEEEELAAKRKEDKQKNMLASFIKRAPTPSKKPAEQATNPRKPERDSPTPQVSTKPQKSAYERTFKPFFVKPGVTLAHSPFEMDEETRAAKSSILDEYIRGERGEFNPKPFDPIKTFEMPFPQKRGIMRPSVRKIMEGVHADRTFGTTRTRSESQTERLVTSAQDQLNSIPMKRLCFYEDVRPPYFGTMTTPMDKKKLRTLSRRPVGRVLTLDYDYESEAEWVEDDGEDLGDEEDDEDDHEGDEEMDDFLDDSEDVPAVTRPTYLGEKEPKSTGICFEDHTRLSSCATVYKYRLEFVLDTLEHHHSIDPFSTSYWPAPQKKVGAAKVAAIPTTVPLASMPPPNAPTDAFSMLVSGTATSAAAVEAKELVPKDVLDDFKRAIISDEFREFSKATIVDLLAKKFSCTKAQVKATLDRIAHRVSVPGAKKSVKQWDLLPAFAS